MVINFSFNRKRPIMGVYCIQNAINNKRYIGSSVNVLVRLEKHRSLLRSNKHENLYLQNAWNKYGEDNFICYLLEAYDTDVKEYLTKKEQSWIDSINSEYNLTRKVERNELSQFSRLKQSETRKRLFKEGKLIPSSYKKVKKYDLDANFISEYKSLTDAADSENLHTTTVLRSAKKYTSQGGGFIWRYSDDTSKVYSIQKASLRKKYGYKDLVKSDKLLENPGEDNQQPI